MINQTKAIFQDCNLPPYFEGSLSTYTFVVKDLLDIKGYKTGCGNPSWLNRDFPAASHAICIEQLLCEGATCIGKTITDEFAFGLDGENYFYGTPTNPKAPEHVPGGSSSGSASAVASRIADFALGTDTCGSIRVPASNCGIFGWRPTHGSLSTVGIKPFAPSLDTVGVFTRTSALLKLVAQVLLSETNTNLVEASTIYLLEDAFLIADQKISVNLEDIVNLLKTECNLKVKICSLFEISPNYGNIAIWQKVQQAIQWAEIWNSLGSWIENIKPVLGPRTAQNFKLVQQQDRKEIASAIKNRKDMTYSLTGFLKPYDLLCLPTTPALAPLKGSLPLNRTKGDYYPRVLALNSIAGLTGLPQVSLPALQIENVPVGLSFIATSEKDMFLLSMAHHFANALGIN